MRISRRDRPDRGTRKPLPRSGSELLGVDNEPLAELLAAASAPPRPGELAGEEAALAAFRAARETRTQPSPATTRRGRGIRTGAGVWAAVVAATATAGVALAAGTRFDGTEPVPAPSSSQATPAVPSPTPSAAPSTTAVPPTTPMPAASAQVTPPSGAGSGERGLCQAYLAKGGAERGKSLDTPAFGALVEAAGGRDRVTAYCEEFIATESGPGGGQRDPGQGNAGSPGRDPSKSPGGGPRR